MFIAFCYLWFGCWLLVVDRPLLFVDCLLRFAVGCLLIVRCCALTICCRMFACLVVDCRLCCIVVVVIVVVVVVGC